MLYQNLDIKNVNKIPKDLLKLFIIYQENIIDKSNNTYNNLILKESSDEYVVINYILNTPKNEKSFNEALFDYIDNSGFTEIEVYKKANINRRLFSKIRSASDYHPSFGTLTALALALELSLAAYEYLLKCASYSLPLNSYINITLKYCFDNKIYDINAVNSLLYEVSNKLLKDL